jgi:hypothetical protein
VMLDDNLAGLGEFRAGDRVILALREEPGMMRVSSIAKSQARANASNPPATVIRPAASVAVAVPAGLSAFSDRVAALSQQAGQIDVLWSEFKTSCSVTPTSSYPDGRGWFGLWEEGSVQMDMSSGPCRDMFNQIVSRGETVKSGMAQAEEAARKADLAPGDLRDVRRRYAMEWGGWSLAAPEPLKQ